MANPTNSDTEMRIDPQRAKLLVENLQNITQRVEKVADGRKIRIIAVSKLKPANDILALHQSPQHAHLDFGENYAQELTEKALLLPPTIRWHMIGALQTNKCKPLAEQVANLYCVSSVDTAKKADALDKGRAALAATRELPEKLRVLVQVNTSGEEAKSGVAPAGEAVAALCRHVRERCPHLRLAGLMTIGAVAANQDFVALRELRDQMARAQGGEPLELSMGMSADFEAAVRAGSDEVRIGTGVFGERPARGDARVRVESADEGEKA